MKPKSPQHRAKLQQPPKRRGASATPAAGRLLVLSSSRAARPGPHTTMTTYEAYDRGERALMGVGSLLYGPREGPSTRRSRPQDAAAEPD